MIKISRMADYSVVVLSALSDNDGALMAACGLSQKTNLPEPTVAKVLKLLCKGEIVSSVRGAGGGYTLNKDMRNISIADIITVIDGPIALTACTEGSADNCSYSGGCSVRGRWGAVNNVIQSALDDVKLADMIGRAV